MFYGVAVHYLKIEQKAKRIIIKRFVFWMNLIARDGARIEPLNALFIKPQSRTEDDLISPEDDWERCAASTKCHAGWECKNCIDQKSEPPPPRVWHALSSRSLFLYRRFSARKAEKRICYFWALWARNQNFAAKFQALSLWTKMCIEVCNTKSNIDEMVKFLLLAISYLDTE